MILLAYFTQLCFLMLLLYSAPEPLHARDAVIQFGKCGPSLYVLDIQHPFSIIQAFGAALSTFLFAEKGDVVIINKLHSYGG